MTEQEIQRSLKTRWLRAAAFAPVLLILGLLYAWSLFIAPLEAEFGWLRTETSVTFTVSMIAFCFGSFLAARIARQMPARVSAIICGILMCLGFIGASRANTLWFFILCYGGLAGFGTGVGYNVTVALVSAWFPDRRGIMSGVSLMFFGVGSFVLGSVVTNVMEAMGWRQALIVIGLIAGIGVVLASAAFKFPPEGMRFPEGKKIKSHTAAISLKPSQVLRSPEFYVLFAWISIRGGGHTW